MRCRVALLILIVLVVSLLPVRAHAQAPLDLAAYTSRLVQYMDEATPLVNQVSASVSALRVDHTLVNDTVWRLKLQRTIRAYKAANAQMYEIGTEKYLTDMHLYLVASLGYTDASLTLLQELVKTRDVSLLARIDVLRGNSSVAWDRFAEMYGYFTPN